MHPLVGDAEDDHAVDEGDQGTRELFIIYRKREKREKRDFHFFYILRVGKLFVYY